MSPSAGAICLRKPGDPVEAGEPVLVLHADDEARLPGALAALETAIEVGPEPPRPAPSGPRAHHLTGPVARPVGPCPLGARAPLGARGNQFRGNRFRPPEPEAIGSTSGTTTSTLDRTEPIASPKRNPLPRG